MPNRVAVKMRAPQESWEADYGCVSYPQSTMIGCFCLDAVVTSFREHGLVDGAKMVAREQGAVCAPFLRDYAKANAIKILAVRRGGALFVSW